MNVKTWLPLCLALVLGLVAAKVAKDMIAKNKGDAGNSTTGGTQIVVARRPIAPGDLLTQENLTLGTVGQDAIPENAFKNVSDLTNRVASIQMSRGQAIMDPLLAPPGSGYGIQGVIPLGMRAITIEVNEFSGVGGMLVPGCRVDVLATVQGENGEMGSRSVVQNLTVAAVGQQMSTAPKQGGEPVVFRSVTMIATPEDAETIELAAAVGRPRLVLRGGNDNGKVPTNGITVAELRRSGSRRVDPFSQPVALTPVSTTQTAVMPRSFENSFERVIKIIRGGIETEMRMNAYPEPNVANGAKDPKPTPSDKGVTGTGTESNTIDK